jgi:hypothetical protein
LAYELVVSGYEGVVRGEGPRAALPVHQEGLHFTIHYMLFNLDIGWDRSSSKQVIAIREVRYSYWNKMF